MDEDFNGEEFPQIDQRRTTELTLSPTVLLVLFFVLVLLCGLCFGVGYTMGSRGVQGAQQQGAGAASQAAGSHSKPSAVPQKTPDVQSIVDDLPVTSSGAGADAPHEGQANLAGADATEPLIKPAQPDAASTLMIQVATVTRQEDADILISALSKRGYTATARHDPADNKLHVQIGPFSNRNDANAMSKKLLHDGYNAIMQP
jgi:cell division septation protein DedD